MNYNDFIKYHPWFSLFFELFKGIAPTIAALLAIYINNKSAHKRDHEKSKKDLKTKLLTELQNNVIELNNMLYDAGKEFLNHMHYLDDKETKEETWDAYYKKVTDALMFSRKIMFTANIEIVKIGIQEIEFNDCFEIVAKFPNEISNIIREYDKKAINTLKKDSDKLLDEVQQKLIVVSTDVEKSLIQYAEKLTQKITDINI